MRKTTLIFRLSILSLLAVLIMAAAGCGGGGGSSSGNVIISDPVIDNYFATPYRVASSDGGDVTISATVTAEGGVLDVRAEITKPDNTTINTNMNLKSGNSYECQYSAGPNLRTDKEDDKYTVRIKASSKYGKTIQSLPFYFIVPGPEEPPLPPVID